MGIAQFRGTPLTFLTLCVAANSVLYYPGLNPRLRGNPIKFWCVVRQDNDPNILETLNGESIESLTEIWHQSHVACVKNEPLIYTCFLKCQLNQNDWICMPISNLTHIFIAMTESKLMRAPLWSSSKPSSLCFLCLSNPNIIIQDDEVSSNTIRLEKLYEVNLILPHTQHWELLSYI